MAVDQVCIEARIRFLTAEEGGRRTPLHGGVSYRPNHNFFGPDDREMCIGFIELPEGREVQPGDTIDVPLTLLIWPKLKGKIHEGRQWRIQEGGQLVATGTVLHVSE
jgi:translation elongation factor EF-Tu-like GTPase